jgi:hypothetical protein
MERKEGMYNVRGKMADGKDGKGFLPFRAIRS